MVAVVQTKSKPDYCNEYRHLTLGFVAGESDSKMLSSPELLKTRLDAEEGALRVGVGLDDLRLHVDDVALGSIILPPRINDGLAITIDPEL